MPGGKGDLWHGFEVIFGPPYYWGILPNYLVFTFLGVLIGNIVGVLPGMGVLATISILLPLTFGMKPVAAILMLAGVFYGAQYGGAICSILLNLPCHPPHAVTCLDGFPMTKQGRGGVGIIALVLRQCALGDGYPRVLLLAHQFAVLTSSDRAAYFALLARSGLATVPSAKALSKARAGGRI